MSVNEKNILTRLYIVAACICVLAFAIIIKLLTIQLVDGEAYKKLAKKRTIKNFTIAPKRGNLYADDGSLLATSVTRYDIRFDALTPKDKIFKTYLNSLSDSLSVLLGKPSVYYQNLFRKARAQKKQVSPCG